MSRSMATIISFLFHCLRLNRRDITIESRESDWMKELTMRNVFTRTLAAFALLFVVAAPSSASTLGLDVTSDTQVFAPGVFHNIGWQFSVSAPIIIDGLGLFDVNPAGLAESHQVGLWDNGGNLLASATVTSGSTLIASASNAGDWLFANIAPIVLVPGTYVTSGF